MKIKGAIFDMDGTIIDSLMFWDHLWQRIGQTYFDGADFRPSEAVDKAIRTMVYADAMAYLKDACGIPENTEEFVRFASDGLTDFYRDVASVKPGAAQLLSFLKEKGIRLCLASATAMPEIRFALDCHGLLPYFDVLLSCADLGVGKDRPDIYLEAVRRMGLSPAEVCVFEDSFVALETAKAAGFQTVGLYDRYNLEQGRLQAASDLYMGEGHTLAELIRKMEE